MATENSSDKRRSQRRQATIQVFIMLAILVCLNMLGARFHYGLDLTKEKRFTLSPATKTMLKGMDDVAVVEVYLKGKFPAGFQRLAEATRERLTSFKEYAGSHIIFHFVNPFEGKEESEKGPIFNELLSKGVKGISLQVEGGEEGYSEKIVFPYALVNYKGRSMAVSLMDNHLGMNSLEMLNYSESLLEYKFADAIHKLNSPTKPSIAYIMGHGEALGLQTLDMLTTLAAHYTVDTIDLPSTYYIPSIYSTIIINKPTDTLSDKEKFKIDQYVMNGGHVLWCLDMLHAYTDSLMKTQQFITTDYPLNLDDILFRWGIRINYDYIEDLQCNAIPLMENGEMGQPKPWIYFPYFTPTINHPIVNNMDAVMGQFVSSIDTIRSPEIKKTILLSSSKYSRPTPSPVRVNLTMLLHRPPESAMNKPYKPVAVLLEGPFHSVFANRLPPSFIRMMDSVKHPVKYVNDSPTSQIVISDGDMFLNSFSQQRGPMEMGYWMYTQKLYANKSFLLNCMEYLTGNSGLLEARSKDMRLRLLDEARVKQERKTWQFVNIGIPLILVLVFASCYLFFRKRKYEKPA